MVRRTRLGAIASLIEAGTFVFGFSLFTTVLADYATGDPTPAEAVGFLMDNQTALIVGYVVVFVVFGVALVPLVLAVHGAVRKGSSALAEVATVFGFIWAGLVIAAGMIAIVGVGTVADLADSDPARAEPVWSTLDSVQNALGGGIEIVGGLWVLLVSVAALRAATLPRTLGYLGLVVGAAGCVTVAPPLEVVGAVFGLGLIVWFTWLGVVLLRRDDALTGAHAAEAAA